MASHYTIPQLPLSISFDSPKLLKQLIASHRALAELKGVARTLPNEQILISTLPLQEARESSLIENIVTTQDDLYHAEMGIELISQLSAKEVLNYRDALSHGFEQWQQRKVLTLNIIKDIQMKLERNRAGFRAVPGTVLKRNDGVIIYTPPQEGLEIEQRMQNLEMFINDDELSDIDPIVKMAIIHHQFESIHPFYDGNGRTGRILNVLLLVHYQLLEQPILYLSRYITKHKEDYYRLIQNVREQGTDNQEQWEEWVTFMAKGVESMAVTTKLMIEKMQHLMMHFKQVLRTALPKVYSHDLLNNLFRHPYTKIEFLMRDLQISRATAGRYLDQIVALGLLEKQKAGKENYYINTALLQLFEENGSAV